MCWWWRDCITNCSCPCCEYNNNYHEDWQWCFADGRKFESRAGKFIQYQVLCQIPTQSSYVPQTTNPTITAAPADVITLTEVMSSTTVTAVLTGTATPLASATAPLLVIGSSTITPSPAPFSLPAVPASAFSILGSNGTTVPPSGTVTGTGVGNYSGTPFQGGAVKPSGFATIIWGTALAVAVAVVGLL